MANAPMGNNFFEGPLGVIYFYFDGVDMGKTLDNADLEFIEDMKEIFYAQDGTQPADQVPTGQAWRIKGKIAEITLTRLQKVLRGLTVTSSGNAASAGADLYRSGRDNFAKELKVYRVDSDGNPSTDHYYRLKAYKALPKVTGPIGEFGPDNQRVFDIEWYLFRDSAHNDKFWICGPTSSLGSGY